MSEAFSAESEDSILDSRERDTGTSSSASPTPIGETYSELAGPESISTTMSDESLTPWLPQRQRIHDARQTHPTLQGGKTGDRGFNVPNVLISYAEDSPARTSPSPAGEPDLPESDPDFSSTSPESLSLFDQTGYSSRTYPVSSLATAVGTSESCLERWPTSGTAWVGGFSTHVSSECRSADGVCSSSEPSLTEILDPPQSVPARYSLSARAAAGILQRAAKSGHPLPTRLRTALEIVR